MLQLLFASLFIFDSKGNAKGGGVISFLPLLVSTGMMDYRMS